LIKKTLETQSSWLKKVGFSRTHLFDVIDEFKQMGVEIYFNKDKQSYCYAGSHRLKISNPVTIIDECEIISTMGGYYITSNKLLKLLLPCNQ